MQQINADNVNNIRLEASKLYFRINKRQYMKGKINDLETNSNNKKLEICIEA